MLTTQDPKRMTLTQALSLRCTGPPCTHASQPWGLGTARVGTPQNDRPRRLLSLIRASTKSRRAEAREARQENRGAREDPEPTSSPLFMKLMPVPFPFFLAYLCPHWVESQGCILRLRILLIKEKGR